MRRRVRQSADPSVDPATAPYVVAHPYARTQPAKSTQWPIAAVSLLVIAAAVFALRLLERPAFVFPLEYAVCTRGERLYTSDPAHPQDECVVVADSTIIAIDSLANVRRTYGDKDTLGSVFVSHGKTKRSIKVHTLPAAYSILPGLTDAHGHVLDLGHAAAAVTLKDASSEDHAARLVSEYIRSHPQAHDAILDGYEWDQTRWTPAVFPTARAFERYANLRDLKIVLKRVDFHALWLSQAAIDSLEPLPDQIDGGLIVRDETGRPTGVFLDAAMDFVVNRLPSWTDAQMEQYLHSAASRLLGFGIVGVHDAAVTLPILAMYKRLDAQKRLPLDIYAMVLCPELDQYCGDAVEAYQGHRLTVRSVKLFVDGALGSYGAYLHKPYSDDKSTRGILRTPAHTLKDLIQRWNAKGFQVNVHAIGDAANAAVLDGFESLLPEDLAVRRHRIEHAQIMTDQDVQRAARLGVIASVQPAQATSDMGYAEDRLGPERIRTAYAWRTFLNANVSIVLGSDFPVESANPFQGMHSAISRLDLNEQSPHGPQGWYSDQVLTRQEALAGFTSAPAFASFQEKRLGMLKPGMRADFVVIDRDLLAVPVSDMSRTPTMLTVLDGRVVHNQGFVVDRPTERDRPKRRDGLGAASVVVVLVDWTGRKAMPSSPSRPLGSPRWSSTTLERSGSKSYTFSSASSVSSGGSSSRRQNSVSMSPTATLQGLTEQLRRTSIDGLVRKSSSSSTRSSRHIRRKSSTSTSMSRGPSLKDPIDLRRTPSSSAGKRKASPLTAVEIIDSLAERKAMLESHEPLVLDVRSITAFLGVRLQDSINVSIPSLLLKRLKRGINLSHFQLENYITTEAGKQTLARLVKRKDGRTRRLVDLDCYIVGDEQLDRAGTSNTPRLGTVLLSVLEALRTDASAPKGRLYYLVDGFDKLRAISGSRGMLVVGEDAAPSAHSHESATPPRPKLSLTPSRSSPHDTPSRSLRAKSMSLTPSSDREGSPSTAMKPGSLRRINTETRNLDGPSSQPDKRSWKTAVSVSLQALCASQSRTPSRPRSAAISPSDLDHDKPEVFSVASILAGRLYLGPEPGTEEDVRALEQLGVRRILNLALEVVPKAELKMNTRFEQYHHILMRDFVEEQGVHEFLLRACFLISDANMHDAPIYCHCRAGKSRSVTAVLAYLIRSQKWTLKQAYKHVADRRPGISPNIGFVSSLMQWESEELGDKANLAAAADPREASSDTEHTRTTKSVRRPSYRMSKSFSIQSATAAEI
ncbi:uncharacterized protein L969DRAFT_42432 [Mixia osmundae IAM 14324]|uniref:Uncharacterized protein n=1 Tax=Mixia osmundae (strain CBS 9802 / IAM 14324 / JCM 22182 / KY 12970) TaxID=764103 RepID=G7E2X5_MIXOS|nr:uncharacterized protein L969DRAFT_42432 [Mixia osmundae IAM 14324]KEI42556.1 hypothetical protein L969DRAFT_42432 [Mixia osmundae IAM 14324]GAA97156.1 hypothetical protein E5Q_03832 [Mixia osmundae IAM 14324]